MAHRAFASWHRWDRIAFPAFVGLIWFGILMGFVPEIAAHMAKGQGYRLLTHVHAFLFVGWMVLLTVQVGLIRAGRVKWHKRLGMLAICWAAAMTFVGPATAVVATRAAVGTKEFDPAFLAIQLSDILGFVTLTAWGLAMRRSAAAHKRLMVLGTMYISDAGYARWLFLPLVNVFGSGFWGNFIGGYGATDLIVLLVGAYDLATRKRLHPVYLPALAFIVCLQVAATLLYLNPGWKPVALRLLGL